MPTETIGPMETWLRHAQDHGRWPPDESAWEAKARQYDTAFAALESATDEVRNYRDLLPEWLMDKIDAALAVAEGVRS